MTAAPAAAPTGVAEAPTAASASAAPPGKVDVQALIARAAKDLSDYQRLTAEGKLGEAGQKLDELKRTLEELSKR